MKKVSFSNKELHRFLLLGDTNTYVTDKIFPLIRAIKRKNYLSIFCTLRIKNETTTIKLGNFPENNIDEIYAKFDIAKKISKNGNNPNYIFSNNLNSKNKILSNENLEMTFEKLILIFFKKKELTERYRVDMKNSIKRFLQENFFQPIKRLDLKTLEKRIIVLLKEKKIGTARNILNYLNTLSNFAIKNKFFHDHDSLILIIEKIGKIKQDLIKERIVYENKNYKGIIAKIKKLPRSQFKILEDFVEKLQEESHEKRK